MDWEYQYQIEETPWDKGEAAPPLVEFLDKKKLTGHVLIPGCGKGHDVRLIAAKGSETGTHASGMDLSSTALELARKKTEEDQTPGFIDFIEGDFLNPPKHLEARFDWIFEHTLFCAIEPSLRPDYVRMADRLLKPRGKILAIFYMTPEHDEGPPFPSTSNELDVLFSSHFSILEEWVPGRAYEGREGHESMRILEKL
ncbi:MAG: methyltransferase domain-containing protein [Verrucomicrobiota bacterium]